MCKHLQVGKGGGHFRQKEKGVDARRDESLQGDAFAWQNEAERAARTRWLREGKATDRGASEIVDLLAKTARWTTFIAHIWITKNVSESKAGRAGSAWHHC